MLHMYIHIHIRERRKKELDKMYKIKAPYVHYHVSGSRSGTNFLKKIMFFYLFFVSR